MAIVRPLVLHSLHTFKQPCCGSVRLESTHVYKEVIPWKNSKSLADHLAKNVLFNERGLVVINKPYGVGSSPKTNAKQYVNASPVGEQVLNIYDALPYLAKKIGHDNLFIGSIPERYTSGVTVLATSTNLQKRVKACLELSKISNDTMNQYYAVVVGSPSSTSGSFKLAIRMSSKVPNQPILEQLTRKVIKDQTIHSVRVVFSTLSSSNLASLMAIRSSTAKLNALRITCTDKFISPILGDNMFGSRVKTVLGRAVLVGFNESNIKKPQNLSAEVLKALELTDGETLIVPNHLHLHEVYLAKYFDLDIILRAPLPPVMQWSCNKLGLDAPECKPCEKLLRSEVLKQRATGDSIVKQEEEHIEIGVSTQ